MAEAVPVRESKAAVKDWPASLVTRMEMGVAKGAPLAFKVNAHSLLVIKAYEDTASASLSSTLAMVSASNPLTVTANHHTLAPG